MPLINAEKALSIQFPLQIAKLKTTKKRELWYGPTRVNVFAP